MRSYIALVYGLRTTVGKYQPTLISWRLCNRNDGTTADWTFQVRTPLASIRRRVHCHAEQFACEGI